MEGSDLTSTAWESLFELAPRDGSDAVTELGVTAAAPSAADERDWGSEQTSSGVPLGNAPSSGDTQWTVAHSKPIAASTGEAAAAGERRLHSGTLLETQVCTAMRASMYSAERYFARKSHLKRSLSIRSW